MPPNQCSGAACRPHLNTTRALTCQVLVCICFTMNRSTTIRAYIRPMPGMDDAAQRKTAKAAGATVCISEAEPIPELMADGWHAVEISATRRGAKRTFSKQQAEWLTLSRPPSFVPRETLGLFG